MEAHEINWDAYIDGADLCTRHYMGGPKANNPHEPGTNDWKSWNKGWNSVDPN